MKKTQLQKIRDRIHETPVLQESSQNKKAFEKVSTYRELRDHFKV